MHLRGLLGPLHLGVRHRRLEPRRQRLVAALGVEVVGDDEQLLVAVEQELADERLAADGPGALVGSIRPGETTADLVAVGRARTTVTRGVGVAARAVDERRRGRVEQEHLTRMLPPGWPPSVSSTGSI